MLARSALAVTGPIPGRCINRLLRASSRAAGNQPDHSQRYAHRVGQRGTADRQCTGWHILEDLQDDHRGSGANTPLSGAEQYRIQRSDHAAGCR